MICTELFSIFCSLSEIVCATKNEDLWVNNGILCSSQFIFSKWNVCLSNIGGLTLSVKFLHIDVRFENLLVNKGNKSDHFLVL